MDLHGQIMNIQTTSANIGKAVEAGMAYDTDWKSRLALAYRLGHRDARHAAAELAIIHVENKSESNLKSGCLTCIWYSETAEYHQCETCKRQPALDDNYQPTAAEQKSDI